MMVKKVWRTTRSLAGMVVAIWAMGVHAGAPSVVLDYDYRTAEIDGPVRYLPEGTECLLAIACTELSEVHSYSVKIEYDENVVRFEGAGKNLNPTQTPFLETNGGSIAAFLVVPSKSGVEIAVTLAGGNPTTTASGSGVLGYLRFRALDDGVPRFEIKEVKIVDVDGVVTKVESEDENATQSSKGISPEGGMK